MAAGKAAETFALHPEIQQLSQALVDTDEGVAFEETALDAARDRWQALTPDVLKERIAELAAYGARIAKSKVAGADLALGQLVLLAAELMGSAAKAADQFRKAGVAPGKVNLNGAAAGKPLPTTAPDKLWK